ncbi:hypothetical protein [Streptomyces sp. NBC_01565]|uniref:hypothetical protein n=1 Tax=unclassified Streptomyces TaxID=2593676 RepID=UPI0022588DA5|nr:hypothetical protein [Streptomyces sp. NBC_01565]MCX4546564.1 hypothetical protein [Streptomyces sp. NBC_01565]
MLDEAMAGLALTGATTVVAAMATDAWQTTRTGMGVLFRRGGPVRQEAVEAQLAGDAELVALDDDAEGARRDLIPAWNRRLGALLSQYPDAAEDLRALIDEVRAALPRPEQQWTQHNTARDNGRVFAAQNGNIIVHTGPDQAAPPPPAAVPAPEGDGQTS